VSKTLRVFLKTLNGHHSVKNYFELLENYFKACRSLKNFPGVFETITVVVSKTILKNHLKESKSLKNNSDIFKNHKYYLKKAI